MKHLHRVAPILHSALAPRGFAIALAAFVVPAQADLAGAVLALVPSVDAHVAWLALGVLTLCGILGWDIVQMDREMRSTRASFQRNANSRAFRDGGPQ